MFEWSNYRLIRLCYLGILPPVSVAREGGGGGAPGTSPKSNNVRGFYSLSFVIVPMRYRSMLSISGNYTPSEWCLP